MQRTFRRLMLIAPVTVMSFCLGWYASTLWPLTPPPMPEPPVHLITVKHVSLDLPMFYLPPVPQSWTLAPLHLLPPTIEPVLEAPPRVVPNIEKPKVIKQVGAPIRTPSQRHDVGAPRWSF